MSEVFAKTRLTPTQARTVAQRRFDDAEYLRRSGDNARANGVFYLGGLSVECLLKAALLERHPEIASPMEVPHLSEAGRAVRSLVYRSHDLGDMLLYMPDLAGRLERADARDGGRRLVTLRTICSTWSIFVRYSPKTETMDHASKFLDAVRELKEWLK